MPKIAYKIHNIPIYEVNEAFFRLFDKNGNQAEISDDLIESLYVYAEKHKPTIPGEPAYKTSINKPYAVTVNSDKSITIFEMD